jgi:hypothetical protein
MMTSQLRKRLLRQWNDPEVRQRVVLSKCGAGLVIVALIAFIGLSAAERRDDFAQSKETVWFTQAAEPHRRELFEQRRATFELMQHGRAARQQLPANKPRSALTE